MDEGPRVPLHPNCRCSRVPVTASWKELGIEAKDIPPGMRESMNGEVPETLDYGQWLRRQDRATVLDHLGKKRGQWFLDGKLEISDFVDDRSRVLTLDELKHLDR